MLTCNCVFVRHAKLQTLTDKSNVRPDMLTRMKLKHYVKEHDLLRHRAHMQLQCLRDMPSDSL